MKVCFGTVAGRARAGVVCKGYAREPGRGPRQRFLCAQRCVRAGARVPWAYATLTYKSTLLESAWATLLGIAASSAATLMVPSPAVWSPAWRCMGATLTLLIVWFVYRGGANDMRGVHKRVSTRD